MALIQIISRPEGDAPDEIRDKWIGTQMECLGQIRNDTHTRGIKGRLRPQQHSYLVQQIEAIAKLSQQSLEAAKYWNHIGYPKSLIAVFTFRADCVKEIEPVPDLTVD